MAQKVIYLPNSEQAGQLMENAWQDFAAQMKQKGMGFEGTKVAGLLKDIFMSGYCYGHNDSLTIIRDQMEVDDLLKYADLLGQGESGTENNDTTV